MGATTKRRGKVAMQQMAQFKLATQTGRSAAIQQKHCFRSTPNGYACSRCEIKVVLTPSGWKVEGGKGTGVCYG
jgi:hypothetical protein